jgi:heptosyltransferase-2
VRKKPGEIPNHERLLPPRNAPPGRLIDQLPESPMIRLPGIPYLQKACARRLEGTWIGLSPGAAYGTAKRWLPVRLAAAGVEVASPPRAGRRLPPPARYSNTN